MPEAKPKKIRASDDLLEQADEDYDEEELEDEDVEDNETDRDQD